MPKQVWEKVKYFFSKGKKGKKAVRNTIIAIVIAALLGGSYYGYQKFSGKATGASAQTAIVKRDNISKNIEGSGTIEAINQYEVTALVKGEILSDNFEEGQMINKGDLMYTIDSSDLENNIKKAQASVEKSQLTYDQSAKTVQNLNIKSGVSGVVKTLYVKNGDNVSNGAKIADIINTQYMKLKINFNSNDARQLSVGQTATVNLESSFGSLDGEITSIGSGSLINDDGVLVTIVEISVYNPGGIKTGDIATAIAGGYACNAPGTFEYFEQETVVTETSGKVKNLNFKEGDYINNGASILKLESDSTTSSVRQNALSLEDSKLALQNYYEQLNDYNITAPISGKVIQKNSKAGDKIDNSNSSTVMAIIADLSTLVFEISVDELDIGNIKVGQEVEITADAVEGKTFTGHVDNISIVGTASNGVTSYPVKVVLNSENSEQLIPGMNVNAKIVIESREDVLIVPLSAINRGNTVIVKSTEQNAKQKIDLQNGGNKSQGKTQGQSQGQTPQAQGNGSKGSGASAKPSGSTSTGTAKSGNAQSGARNVNIPEGYQLVRVEIGLNDGDNVEVISGLNEGDVVMLPDKTATTTQTQQMPGMMGGGMMGGGMPGGGTSGGNRTGTTGTYRTGTSSSGNTNRRTQ